MTATTMIPELRVGCVEAARMQAAAAVLADCRLALGGDRAGILRVLGTGLEPLAEWQHYPPGEVYDLRSHAQYFYHAHPTSLRPDREHGHFHTFLRAEGMPLGVVPLVLPEIAVAGRTRPAAQAAPLKRGTREELSHIVAIALDAGGEPIRLFTTNRWVTGESWYRADDVIRMLDRFTLETAEGPALLNRWVSAIVALFRPQIAALLRIRDATVMNWRRRRRSNVFEDPRLEITSSLDIDIEAQLAFLDRLRPDPGAAAAALRLPSMTEGWGEGYAD